MSDDPLCQEETPEDATNKCCVAVFCSSSEEEYDYDSSLPSSDQGLPESVLKSVDLSAKPLDGADEFQQVSSQYQQCECLTHGDTFSN